MKQATERQKEILAAIKLLSKEKGYAPSFKEMADYFGVNRNAIECHIAALKKKGLVNHTPNVARSISVIEEQI